MFAPRLECTKRTMLGPLLEVEMSKKCTPLLARSTFRSQNVQNTPLSDHFWKLRCRKSARRCGAKHISKSKCTKHTIYTPQHYNYNYITQLHSTTATTTTTLHYTPLHCTKLHYTTSSTAQGGGGSFKNRKPIGEVGCCESGMAERTTDGLKGG